MPTTKKKTPSRANGSQGDSFVTASVVALLPHEVQQIEQQVTGFVNSGIPCDPRLTLMVSGILRVLEDAKGRERA